ncbi:Exocyst complex component EXO84 [Grifola frondosa]|uniref:Exocyst complex component EXO84 n=1 Tax=Grifola frondosa TaxID=5627 RepID=A0A1C7LUX0_GRIFR|nr:Exocyst complex component EXO84 [Grifola frondosa]
MKKRMSMRYADISAPTDATVPDVPSLPIGFLPASLRGPDAPSVISEEPKEDPQISELRLLDEENFDPDAYMKLKLANSTEAELRSLQSSLQAHKDGVALDLKRNVFQNYAEFVLVSKEVSTLENEMLEFKESLAEWKGMPSLLHIDESASVAVRFVLLDDAVLVAKRRRRRNNAENDKLVAERCWPLNEMLVLDTKDTSSMSNVFKIRHGKETHVYRTEIASEKKSLLAQFRLVAEELAAKKRKEREANINDERVFGLVIEIRPPLASEMGASAKEKSERDARGLAISRMISPLRLHCGNGKRRLPWLSKAKRRSMPCLRLLLNSPHSKLPSPPRSYNLSVPSNRKSTVVSLITLLVRLKAGPAALNTFLAARADVIRKCVRKITFEGHIGIYIGDLAIVVFTGIKHTADWFLASFRENEVASSFVEWAKHQIELYAEMFRKQVYSSDVDPKTIDEAIQITQIQSKKLLEEYGIDFRFLLETLLVEKPKDNARPRPFRAHSQKEPEPTHTPASTPVRSRSPAISVDVPSRTRTPIPAVPPCPLLLPFQQLL